MTFSDFKKTMTIHIYGIKNCDTMKKALTWLQGQEKAYLFHDYRKDGLDEALLMSFVCALGWEALLNKRGTTFRNLSEEQKNNLNEHNAIKLMLENPAIIKRPLLCVDGTFHLGFKAEQYQSIF